MKTLIACGVAMLALATSAASHAGAWDAKLKRLVDSDIREWLNDPVVINSIKQQNDGHARLTQADVDRLDKQWRAERKASEKPMINSVMGNSLSRYLKDVSTRHAGLYSEIFVMDNKGLNVGQSEITSDYWQGDEDKWQKSYLTGADSIFIDATTYDRSSSRFQIQVSVPVVDPETKQVIGAATIGVAMRELAYRQ
jgi:hypothetical protein